MAAPVIQDPEASITLLTGDDWAPWMRDQLREAMSSVHLAVYMISPYWSGPTRTKLDLVAALAEPAIRGVPCRLIVDQPNVGRRSKPFNIDAALQLAGAGWKVRVMPDNPTLHEKILILDRRVSVIGSHNISKASAKTNYDTSLAIASPALAQLLYRQFWTRWRAGKPLEIPA